MDGSSKSGRPGTRRSRSLAERRGVLFGTLALALVASTASAGPAVHLPDQRRPPVLEGLTVPEGALALDVSPDGRRAALAVVERGLGRGASSRIHLHSLDGGASTIPLPGLVRDLLYLSDSRLVAIQHRPAKRREGDSYLVEIDFTTLKARRGMRLPPSARGLALWTAGGALLVATRDEIRSFALPSLRSGPLYRVLGENHSLAPLGGSRILVGQDDALLLVDLAEPQQREGMPVRESIVSPGPVLSIAVALDGSRGVARLAGNRVVALSLDPLRIEEVGSGLVLGRRPPASEAVRASAEALDVAATRASEDEPRIEATRASADARDLRELPDPPAIALPDHAPDPAHGRDAEPIPEAESPAEPSASPAAEPLTSTEPLPPREARSSKETRPAAPRPQLPATGEADAQLRGRISGPAADQVVAVVLHGPDNLLREAARVSVGADGSYRVAGLPPGRYSVQLDGGGSRSLAVVPPFRHVTITPGATAAADFRVLRAF